jgi:predicted regulator of Ras-like GTPase activity (Roadblock/LC7/MglB family)
VAVTQEGDDVILQETQTLTVLSLLQQLKTRVDGVEDALCLWSDGGVLAHLQPTPQSAPLETLLAEFVSLAECACLTSVSEGRSEAMLQGQERFLAFYRDGSQAVLGVLGHARTNTELLHAECRSTLDHIRAVVSEGV